ncbi:MAG: Abi family protein [Oscillochloridaceae bacterium umkhey_bin13]
MRYEKPPLSFAQQADRLIQRGLLVSDRDQLIERLSTVSYYRLSAYWHPFKQADNRFSPGTSFETVWQRYVFDRHLRLIVMDAIERVEVAVLRTRMVEHVALTYGPFSYRQRTIFQISFNDNHYQRLLEECDQMFDRSKELFADHFRAKYTAERYPPLWMMAEVMTYGQLLTMYRNLKHQDQKAIASNLGLAAPVLDSWLHTLHYTRNVVAHHARLWNRHLAVKPRLPKPQHRPEFHTPVATSNDRVFGVLSLLRYLMMQVAPQSRWPQRLANLLAAYPDLPYAAMGFPPNWQEYPLWRE